MSACKWNGRDEPRVIPGEHFDECDTPGCGGCWPCPERHCLSCGRVHAEANCPECIATARGDLLAIVRMCGYPLLEEVLSKGAQSDAAMLLGPAANTEAWRYRATSAMFGRVDAAYLEDCRDEAHPLWTLGWIENEWREAFGHPDSERTTISEAARYVGEMLHVVANLVEMPDGSQPPEFADAKRRLADCRAHLENILGDRNQGDVANVGCFECGAKLERRLTDKGFEDVWTCQRCRRKYTWAEYNFALRAALDEQSKKSSDVA